MLQLTIPAEALSLYTPYLHYTIWWRVKNPTQNRSLVAEDLDLMAERIKYCRVLRHCSRVRLFATPCSLPDSTVHGILQARILEWVAMLPSRGSSWPRDWTCVSFIGRWVLYFQRHLGSPIKYYTFVIWAYYAPRKVNKSEAFWEQFREGRHRINRKHVQTIHRTICRKLGCYAYDEWLIFSWNFLNPGFFFFFWTAPQHVGS